MAWLRGSTDITNFASDMYNLLTGAMAASSRGSGQAGNGITVTGADAWEGVNVANRIIRSKTTESLPAEFTTWRGAPRFSFRTASPGGAYNIFMGRPTFTGTYTNGGTNPRIYIVCNVTTANTNPGNLSGLQVAWAMYTANGSSSPLFSGTLTGWTGTSSTQLIRDGISLTLTLQAGETLATGTAAINWTRGYTSVFTNGIDYWHDAVRTNTSSPIVISNSSGGANNYTINTDYQVAQQADADGFDYMGSWSYYGDSMRGVMTGIHWLTAGAPPANGTSYFIVSATLYGPIYSLNINTGGQGMLHAGEAWDSTNLRVAAPAYAGTLNGQPVSFSAPTGSVYNFNLSTNTSTSYAGSAFINYWISVKANKIIIVLRLDQAQTSALTSYTVLYLGMYTPLYPSLDFSPWCLICSSSQQNAGSAFRYQRPGLTLPYYGSSIYATDTVNAIWYNQVIAPTGLDQRSLNITNPGTQNPSAFDDKWWMYRSLLFSPSGGKDASGNFVRSRAAGLRGTLPGIFVLPSVDYVSTDELVDGSNTYFLITSGSVAMQGWSGGMAILQE